MSQAVIKRTQQMLGKYVTKPPLTEKLLGKPPFRYLHDILSVVVKDHGFLEGLFTPDELSSENIKDKEAKINFLQKWIDATSLAVGEKLAVKPSKIVAGHEVDNTNLLLQAVAKGIENKIDSKDAVKQVLSQPKKASKKESVKPESKKDVSSKSKVPTRIKNSQKPTKGLSSPLKAEAKKASLSQVPGTKRPTGTKDSRSSDRTKSREKKDPSKSRSKDPKSERDKKEKRSKDENSKTKRSKDSSKSTKEGAGPTPQRKANTPKPAKETEPPNQASDGITDEIKSGSESLSTSAVMPNGMDDDVNGEAVEDPLMTFGETPTQLASAGPGDETEPQPVSLPEEIPDSQLPAGEESQGIPEGTPTSPRSDSPVKAPPPSDVDPAIVKAIGLNDPGMPEDSSNGHGPVDAADSGVGSLESPKETTRSESLANIAEPKSDTPVPVPIPPTPGPRPASIRAYHPDLQEIPDGHGEEVSPSNQAAEIPERPRTGIRPRTGRKSARPPSARPAPPRVRERREIPQEEMPRPPTGKPLANVIIDNDQKANEDDEDETNFTVGNSSSILNEENLIDNTPTDPNLEKNKQELLEGDQDAKGILVAQILETKKELEDNRREAFSPETPGHRRVQIEQAFPGDSSRRKEKELIQKDVEKMTSSIQALTRSVNPLAKMLDYLQEDFDSMQKELEMWRKETKKLDQSIKTEQSQTDQQLEPLKLQLEEMESTIYDQRERISSIKSLILRNEERITRLLAGININT